MVQFSGSTIDLLPFGPAEHAQAGRDLRLGPGTVVQPAVATEDLECGTAATPGRLEALDPLELRDRPGPSGAGRLSRTTPRVAALSFGVLDLGVAGLRLFPERLHATPLLRQHPFGLLRRVEEIQAVSQGRCRRILLASVIGHLLHRRRDPFGGVRDDELQVFERQELLSPRLGLAVAGIVAKDGRHARRFDADQGRPPPKKISSSASVWTRGTQAASSASRTGPAFSA